MNCSLCHSDKKTLLGKVDVSTYYQCDDCGLIRIEPHPTDEELKGLYEDYVGYQFVEDRETRMFRDKTRILPLLLLSKGRKFLDIGCNVGPLVEAARRLGCEASGIDISPKAIGFAKQLYPQCRFFNESLEQFKERNLKHDIVYCSEVIEHVRDLHGFMDALVAVLNPGAVLFFTTPDSAHYRVPKDKLKWKEMLPVQHVALFNTRNIAKLFRQYSIKPLFFFPMHRANIRFVSRFLP